MCLCLRDVKVEGEAFLLPSMGWGCGCLGWQVWCASTSLLPPPAQAARQVEPGRVRGARAARMAEVGGGPPMMMKRRGFAGLLLLGAQHSGSRDASCAGQPKRLCDAACEKLLENVPMVMTESGLQYKDIKVGSGPSPPVGYQVAANYVAMIPSGMVFDSSLEKGQPYFFRVGVGQVIKGLDEGLLGMKVGGMRRLYIPGVLAFPKGLSAAAGRPRVAPNSPVVFDVSLEYVPGLDDELE